MNRKMILQVIQGKRPLADVIHYIIGNYRYKLYYSTCKGAYCMKPKKHVLMRQHVYEQIQYRIKVMNPTCFNKGECIKCGCTTTALQMANKRCDGICYPSMMNKEEWERFKTNGYRREKDGMWMNIITMHPDKTETTKNIFYKETNNSYVPTNKD